MRFIHLSDIHLRSGWHEEQQLVLGAFLEDFRGLIAEKDTYVIVSGDLARAGAEMPLYTQFEAFLSDLTSTGFTPSNLIVVPGNHDVDAAYVKRHLGILTGINAVIHTEKSANDFFHSADSKLLSAKFSDYLTFQGCNTLLGCGDTALGSGLITSS